MLIMRCAMFPLDRVTRVLRGGSTASGARPRTIRFDTCNLPHPTLLLRPSPPRSHQYPPPSPHTTTRHQIDPHSQDTDTWTIPHDVAVTDLQSRLSSAAVHPLFLLTDPSLEDEYRALVGEIGFGAVAAVNQTEALAANYNHDYLS